MIHNVLPRIFLVDWKFIRVGGAMVKILCTKEFLILINIFVWFWNKARELSSEILILLATDQKVLLDVWCSDNDLGPSIAIFSG